MEENKNLKLARQARAENNSEDAKLFYGKVREEDPESGEAKFFYAYYSLYEGTNGELPKRFSNLCNVLTTSIRMVKESGAEKAEQLKIIEEIVKCFVPETWAENRYMNNKNTGRQVPLFSAGAITSVCKEGMNALKALGDQVSELYVADPECTRIAVIAWKEYVSLAQKWYSYATKGEPEIYAEKIKKVDPSYEMPKKAGCISLANKKE